MAGHENGNELSTAIRTAALGRGATGVHTGRHGLWLHLGLDLGLDLRLRLWVILRSGRRDDTRARALAGLAGLGLLAG